MSRAELEYNETCSCNEGNKFDYPSYEKGFMAGCEFAEKKYLNQLYKTMKESSKPVDVILSLLPKRIERNGEHGYLDLLSCDNHEWKAAYVCVDGTLFCLNPDDEKPPYEHAVEFGDSPNVVLQKLYDWCVKNGFIK